MADQKQPGNVVIDNTDQFKLPLGRMAFNDLFVPKIFKETDKPKYSVTLLFPAEETFDTYKDAVRRLLDSEEAKKTLNIVDRGSEEESRLLKIGVAPEDIRYKDNFLKNLKQPFFKETRPEKLEKYPHMVNQFQCVPKKTHTDRSGAPIVVQQDGKTVITKNDKELLYNGCYGVALVSVGIINAERLFLRLHAFQKVKNGDPLGGAGLRANTNLFETFESEETFQSDFQF